MHRVVDLDLPRSFSLFHIPVFYLQAATMIRRVMRRRPMTSWERRGSEVGRAVDVIELHISSQFPRY